MINRDHPTWSKHPDLANYYGSSDLPYWYSACTSRFGTNPSHLHRDDRDSRNMHIRGLVQMKLSFSPSFVLRYVLLQRCGFDSGRIRIISFDPGFFKTQFGSGSRVMLSIFKKKKMILEKNNFLLNSIFFLSYRYFKIMAPEEFFSQANL